MREIVHLQVGQCGNQLGMKFFEIIANEHGLSNEGIFVGDSDLEIQGIPVYFAESSSGKFVPRAILIDLEPSVIDKLHNTKYGTIFRPDNYISGFNGASNNWARGFYTDGADILDIIMEIIRKEFEMCDNVQGFQLLHSIGGGTGSGLGSLLLNKIQEEFPDRMNCTYTVFPSPQISDVVVEPYNVLLTLSHLISASQGTFAMDNHALFGICDRILKLEHPVFGDLNHLISLTMSGVTTSLRFSGQLNADYRKLATNLVPFPNFHFFITSFAPLMSRFSQTFKMYSTHDMVHEAFNCRNIMVACDPSKGKYLTLATMFRGRMSMRDIDSEASDFQNKNSAHFVEWIPHNMKTASCDIPPSGFTNTVTLIGNTTAIQDIFIRFLDLYSHMFQRKAYLHWYLDEGMDISEFNDAEKDLLSLIDNYQLLQYARSDESRNTFDLHYTHPTTLDDKTFLED